MLLFRVTATVFRILKLLLSSSLSSKVDSCKHVNYTWEEKKKNMYFAVLIRFKRETMGKVIAPHKEISHFQLQCKTKRTSLEIYRNKPPGYAMHCHGAAQTPKMNFTLKCIASKNQTIMYLCLLVWEQSHYCLLTVFEKMLFRKEAVNHEAKKKKNKEE